MKRYYEETADGGCTYYVGETADVKALYKSITRNKTAGIYPKYCGFPQFSESKSVYALCIETMGHYDFMSIVNSDTMLYMILNNIVEEAKYHKKGVVLCQKEKKRLLKS